VYKLPFIESSKIQVSTPEMTIFLGKPEFSFLDVCLLTQAVAPNTKEETVMMAAIGPPCVLQADGY
jgi:hypothetical protein